MSRKFRAAVAYEPKAPLKIEDLTIADPTGSEILIQTAATGICHTDLLLRDGVFGPTRPVIPGHEGAGVVIAIGSDVKGIRIGDHVGLSQASCGYCASCRLGHPMGCGNYTQYNLTGLRYNGERAILDKPINANFVGQSSFGSLILATEGNAAVLPKDFPLEVAAPMGCGMATGAGTVFNVLQPEVGSTIAVFGAGAVGMAAIMAARIRLCAKIIAVDLHPSRLELARELGATHIINGRDPDVVEQIMSLTNGGADFSIDAVGAIPVVLNAIKCTRAGAHIVLLGLDGLGKEIPILLDSIVFNRKLSGAILGDQIPQLFLPQLVQLQQRGIFPVERLIKTYPFDQINAAIADAESGRVIKPVLLFS